MKYQRVVLRSYAKVNMGLHILGKREDGYHEIRTIFQSIALHDRITIRRIRQNEIQFSSTCQALSPDDNLVVRAINLLRKHTRLSGGFAVHLEKKIPLGTGLGGGSSNAAAAILGVGRMLNLNLSNECLFEMGGSLGSDVPFFFVGGRALGTGRGSEVYPLEDSARQYLSLVVPSFPVSTVDAYARLSLPLTKKFNASMIPVFCPGYLDGLTQKKWLENDFETVVFEQFPDLKPLKQDLLNLGASVAGLTGSGSALYGVFGSKKTLTRACSALQSKSIRLIQTQTLRRAQYQKGIIESLQ